MNKVKIDVSQKAIDASNCLIDDNSTIESCHDPVALALNRCTSFHGWFIGRVNGVDRARTLQGHNLYLPRKVQKFLDKWESGIDVKPFSFSVPSHCKMPVDYR